MKMFVAGEWTATTDEIEVLNPYDGSVVDTVPKGSAADMDRAVAGLVAGAERMRRMPGHERCDILRRAARLMDERVEELARIISREEGKILAEARVEAKRAGEVLDLSADEARRIGGEVVPLDGAPGGAGKLGFTLRIPCGIVAAITPFNFPMNLVAHKVGPAIAGGNATLIKPASDTPLSALAIVEILLEAGLPEEAIACVTGPGGELGEAICTDDRIRKISFTGSQEVGEGICKMAGLKRVTMELGSNSPVIVMDDADIELASRAITAAGYSNAGQVCISAQRILTSSRVRGDLLDQLKSDVGALVPGDQLDDGTRIGPLVRQSDAERVERMIREAASNGGGTLVLGGERDGSVVRPAILDDVDPNAPISREELFGPAVCVTYFDDVNEAIRLANDTRYGLSAGVFTRDLDNAMRFAREVESGNVHVNWSSQWRADLMPYGGLKDSGLGKEGPKYAVREMTEEKMVVVHLGG